MSTYAIVDRSVEIGEGEELLYLNHSCLGSKSFGSEDMAWTTNDYDKAKLMLESVENKHDDYIDFEVIELG